MIGGTDKIDYIRRSADLSKISEKIEELSKELSDQGKGETICKYFHDDG